MSTSGHHSRRGKSSSIDAVAGNGLLDRRALLGRGVILAGAIGTAPLGSLTGAAAEPPTEGPLTDAPWSHEPGAAIGPYERPSRFEKNVVRTLNNPNGQPGAQGARTPHHLMNGAITPNGLHFVVSWGGAPDIDPDQHRLAIHGLVKRPLVFTLDALARYPMTTRVTFLECGGNSGPLFSPQPLQADLQALHGLASCAEWTGVKLSTLLDEAGIDAKATWFIAEGADAPHLARSVPLKKGLDDAMIALYQNGERLMPANGYPMRLLLPGYEGASSSWSNRP
jgi:sulfane dehydrogenase subunit SoxC